jgi:hypothetical protein
MNRPSSTITAATTAGLLMSLLWGTVNEFTDITISAGYISLSVAAVSAVVGYLKKEKVLVNND